MCNFQSESQRHEFYADFSTLTFVRYPTAFSSCLMKMTIRQRVKWDSVVKLSKFQRQLNNLLQLKFVVQITIIVKYEKRNCVCHLSSRTEYVCNLDKCHASKSEVHQTLFKWQAHLVPHISQIYMENCSCNDFYRKWDFCLLPPPSLNPLIAQKTHQLLTKKCIIFSEEQLSKSNEMIQ